MSKKNDKLDKLDAFEEKIDKYKDYIEQMSPLQKVAYEIAKVQLKSSFCIEKSIGYKNFKLSNKI